MSRKAQDVGSHGYGVGRHVGTRALLRGGPGVDFGSYMSDCAHDLAEYAAFRDFDGERMRYGLSSIDRAVYDRAFVAAVLDLWDEQRGALMRTTFNWTGE